MRDVVVIGGGPAGAAVARALALRGRDVLVLEATAFDGPRFGETLPPEANPLLRELGVLDVLSESHGTLGGRTPNGVFDRHETCCAIESPGTISAWGSSVPQETDFVGNRYGNGWHVDRNAFDALLCRAAVRAGAEVRAATRVTRCDRGDDGIWHVETRAGAGDAGVGAGARANASEAEVPVTAARFVIDASGRNGFRLDGDGGRVVDDVLVAIFVRVEPVTPDASVALTDSAAPGAGVSAAGDLRTLVESVPDGWWYCAPLPSGEAVAVFLTDPAIYANDGIVLGEQLAQAPLARARIGTARIAESHIVHVPSSVRARAAGDGWAAAGDAAAAYDPVSGYGITKALRDAEPLADAVDGVLRGKTEPLAAHAASVRRAFDAYALQRREHYALESRWPDRTFWKNRTAPRSSGRR